MAKADKADTEEEEGMSESLERRLQKAEWALMSAGFRMCDIPACNCDNWHQFGGFYARFQEIKDVVEDAGYSTNGRTLRKAVEAMAADATGALMPTLNDLAAAEADIKRLEAENESLRTALEKTQIGVNHIAVYRTPKWPNYGTSCKAALETLGAGMEYDMWCCWNAAMCARDSLGPTPAAANG